MPGLSANAGWRQRWVSLVEKIERVETQADEQVLLGRIRVPQRAVVLAFANAHAMNLLASSVSFFNALHAADWVLRDGSGMATLFKLLSVNPGFNLNGTDLIPKIITLFNGRRIAFFGTQDPYLQRGVKAAFENYAPQSSFASLDGFLDVDAYLSMAEAHKPDLIVLGMGMPKQETVDAALRLKLGFPCLIVCGGAVIDFFAGRTPRAPLWIRRAGLEWAFRLALEPKRLFHRYVIGNPVFLARALGLAVSHKK